MAFSLTSRHLELRGSWLVAKIQKPDSSWTLARLNLNEHLGNNDGEFDVTMDRWYNSAMDWSCHLRGTLLCAQLRTVAGELAPERRINLDMFVKNQDGSLEFQKLSDSLLLFTAGLTLQDANRLRGLVVGRDGLFYPSELNLDENVGNIGGKFEAGERHYSRSGRNFRLEQDASTVKLVGELMDFDGVYHDAEIDLSDCVVNQKGKLAFFKHDEDFEREDWTHAIGEQIPIFGDAISGLHQGKENENVFYYEIASNTNSTNATIGVAIGAFIGRALGSPVIGTALGAGLATSASVFLDDRIAGLVEDVQARSQLQEATLGRYVLETLRDMLADDAAAPAAEVLAAALNPDIDSWMKSLVAWLEKQELTMPIPTDLSLHALLSKVLKQLQGEPVEEWDTALQQLDDAQTRASTLKLQPEALPEPEPEPEVVPETAAEEASEAQDRVPELQAEGSEVPSERDSQAAKDASKTPTSPEDQQQQQPPKTAAASSGTVSTRQSSDDGGAVARDKASLRGNGAACSKGWHSVFGISAFRRSWTRSKQPKVTTV
ncbi:Cyanovirin-N [Hypoxylon fuscum]|nr:Cyanovirin-N [Hypoxylon fuscum]